VVTGRMLYRYMSEPQWTAAQDSEADRICAALESELESQLGDTHITPVRRTEVVAVTEQGLLVTSLPVHAVRRVGDLSAVDGVVAGYDLRDRWLWAIDPTSVPTVARVDYDGGWGAHPTLVAAILRKGEVLMEGQHSDAVMKVGLDTRQQPSAAPRYFTPDELATLGTFRRLGWAGPPRPAQARNRGWFR
jgi:hypothetical protein